MDQSSFDRIARLLGGATTRRSGLKAAIASALGLAVTGAAEANQHGKGSGKGKHREDPEIEGPCGDGSRKANICTKDKDCCTRVCDTSKGATNKDGKGRCRCVRKGGACSSDNNCCNGKTCANGVCGGSTPPPPPPPAVCDTQGVCASGCAFTTIQAAIDAATTGDTIVIGPGTYIEELSIAKNLTLWGCAGATVKDTGANLRTITITGGSVVEIFDLTIDGTGTSSVIGGGIDCDGQLTLSGTTKVTNGSNAVATDGGCILSHGTGNSVTMKDTSSLETCWASMGGCIKLNDQTTLTMTDSTKIVNGNAQIGGGVRSNGPVTMSGSAEISGCTALSAGGIRISSSTLTMSGSSVIKTNTVQYYGGGIHDDQSIVTMSDSASVSGNTAGTSGGGVFLYYDGTAATLTVTGSATITGNSFGGVYSNDNLNTLTAPAGSITGNSPNNCAGGGISCA